MFYRVITNIPFITRDEAYDYYRDAHIALAKSSVINEGQPNEERGWLRVELCHHDVKPNVECQVEKEETYIPP